MYIIYVLIYWLYRILSAWITNHLAEKLSFEFFIIIIVSIDFPVMSGFILSSSLFICPLSIPPPYTIQDVFLWLDLMNRKYDHNTSVYVCLGYFCVVHQLPAGSFRTHTHFRFSLRNCCVLACSCSCSSKVWDAIAVCDTLSDLCVGDQHSGKACMPWLALRILAGSAEHSLVRQCGQELRLGTKHDIIRPYMEAM